MKSARKESSSSHYMNMVTIVCVSTLTHAVNLKGHTVARHNTGIISDQVQKDNPTMKFNLLRLQIKSLHTTE